MIAGTALSATDTALRLALGWRCVRRLPEEPIIADLRPCGTFTAAKEDHHASTLQEPTDADLRGFSEDQLQTLASLPLSIRWDDYYIGLLFWALSTTLFSYLWLKSRHIPRALAAFGVVSGAWAALCAFVFIANPAFSNTVNLWLFDTPMAIFEVALSVLLLVKPLQLPETGDGVN